MNQLYALPSGAPLEIRTEDGVFRPTGTTTALIDAVVTERREAGAGTVLDLGCGCGIVGLALQAMGLVSGVLHASDASADAARLTTENCRAHGYAVDARVGSVFEPWTGMRFDYIVNDISGVAQALADVSPWFRGIPCASGPDGTDLVVQVLRNAPAHLNRGGTLFFPVLSLSNVDALLAAAREVFPTVRRLSHRTWPLPDDMKDALPLVRALAGEGRIQIEEKFGIVLWSTDVYAASLE
jgi:SAM-dependent methyltransferase